MHRQNQIFLSDLTLIWADVKIKVKNDDRSKFSNLSNWEKKLGIAYEILYLLYALAVTSYLFKRSFHAKDIFCSSENSMPPVCKHIMKVRGDQKGGWGGVGGTPQSFWWGCATRALKPIPVFQTNICELISIPYFTPQ